MPEETVPEETVPEETVPEEVVKNNEMNVEQVVVGEHVGQVKWFNHKLGYGFITYENDDGVKNDIFVHYTAIRYKDNSKSKNLISGEYVEFDIFQPFKEVQVQAENVGGIHGGLLLSEFRAKNFSKKTKRN